MNTLELSDIRRIAPVLRAVRKASGKKQSSIADMLQVTQATISAYESEKSIPSASQWFRFCKEFALSAEHAWDMGLIDANTANLAFPKDVQNCFRLPKRYLRYTGSKVRATRLFIKFFERKFGREKLLKFMEHSKIDPDFFVILGNELNLSFTIELLEQLIQGGMLNKNNLKEFVMPTLTSQIQGSLHATYMGCDSVNQLLRTLVKNINKYDVNNTYEIIEENQEGVFFSIHCREHMRFFPYKTDLLGDFFCSYKKEYLKYFCLYVQKLPADITEVECHFHGAKRCLYKIHLNS